MLLPATQEWPNVPSIAQRFTGEANWPDAWLKSSFVSRPVGDMPASAGDRLGRSYCGSPLQYDGWIPSSVSVRIEWTSTLLVPVRAGQTIDDAELVDGFQRVTFRSSTRIDGNFVPLTKPEDRRQDCPEAPLSWSVKGVLERWSTIDPITRENVYLEAFPHPQGFIPYTGVPLMKGWLWKDGHWRMSTRNDRPIDTEYDISFSAKGPISLR